MSELKTNKVSPATGTALAIGDSGDTITVPSGATLDISASTLTPPATMPASSGVNFTALNATNLGSGTVPTARLGSGSASSSTFLRGDQTYAAAGGGKLLQVVQTVDTTNRSTTSTSLTASGCQVAITPASTSNKVLLICSGTTSCDVSNRMIQYISLLRGVTDLTPAGTNAFLNYILTGQTSNNQFMADIFTMTYLDSPSTTSATTYEISFATESGTIYLGRRGWDETLDSPTVSTAMEIEG